MYSNKNILIVISIVCLINFIPISLSDVSCLPSCETPKISDVTVTSSVGVTVNNSPNRGGQIGSLGYGSSLTGVKVCTGECVVEGDKTDNWICYAFNETQAGYVWGGATNYPVEACNGQIPDCSCDEKDTTSDDVLITQSLGALIYDRPCIGRSLGALDYGATFKPDKECDSTCVEDDGERTNTWLIYAYNGTNKAFVWGGTTNYFTGTCNIAQN